MNGGYELRPIEAIEWTLTDACVGIHLFVWKNLRVPCYSLLIRSRHEASYIRISFCDPPQSYVIWLKFRLPFFQLPELLAVTQALSNLPAKPHKFQNQQE